MPIFSAPNTTRIEVTPIARHVDMISLSIVPLNVDIFITNKVFRESRASLLGVSFLEPSATKLSLEIFKPGNVEQYLTYGTKCYKYYKTIYHKPLFRIKMRLLVILYSSMCRPLYRLQVLDLFMSKLLATIL